MIGFRKGLRGLVVGGLVAMAGLPALAQTATAPTATAPVRPAVTRVEAPASAIFIGNSFFYYNNGITNHLTGFIRGGEPLGPFRSTLVGIGGSNMQWHDVDSYFRPDAVASYGFDARNNIVFRPAGQRLFDLAISPLDTAVIVGTTEDGPVRSSDSGASFQPLAGAPLLVLLTWSGSTLYGVDVDGGIHQSTDNGTTWLPQGSLTGQATAIAASGSKIAALVGDSIVESVDGGASFVGRITEIAPH